MAHPSIKTPKNTYLLDATNEELVAADNEHFSMVQVMSGTTVQVAGGGLFVYVDIDSEDGTAVQKYINPATGKKFATTAEADGLAADFYELVDGNLQSVPVVAGMTIFGRFSKVKVPSGTKAIVYK